MPDDGSPEGTVDGVADGVLADGVLADGVLADGAASDEASDEASEGASAEVVVRNPQGLHLRPATEFARLVQASGCRVRVHYGDTEGDGASVLELAMMAIRPGAHLRLEAHGAGSEAAIAQLVALVDRDFKS